MDFPLIQLYSMNRTKPLVRVKGIDGWLQWDTCDLEGLPPKRERGSMTDMGGITSALAGTSLAGGTDKFDPSMADDPDAADDSDDDDDDADKVNP